MRFYVYQLIDPRDNSIFYVGKGQKNRVDQHEIDAAKGVKSLKCDVIRSIFADGLKPRKEIVERFESEFAALRFEGQMINEIGLENLTNQTASGGIRCKSRLLRDEESVACFADLHNRSKGGKLDVLVMGKPIGLAAILADYKTKAVEAIRKRGQDWANIVAKPYGVQFVGSP